MLVNAPPAAMLDGRYRLGSIIARGGMSTVYRGTDVRLDRPVAIKIMNPQLADDPAFRTRFVREARSVARIDHPAVVDVFDQGDDIGATGPVLFLVMELVEGGTLRDVLRARGAIGVPAAVAAMEPVLAGLAEAHRLGLVHRDVKPENVLISRAGEVKVADFGLVTSAAQAGVSHVGMIMGTVAYLSPEQVETGAADARSDVYAAGVLLYELLVGTPPYTGDTAISVAYRHVNSDVPPPSQIAGDVPPELDELVRRATQRDPAGRPADAAVLLAELRQVAQQLEIPRVPVPVPPGVAPPDPDTVPAGPVRVAPAPGHPGSAARVVGGPGGTRTMERPPNASLPPPHLEARQRSRRIFAVWMAIIIALAVLVGTVAWWLGSGRWTAMPPVVGLQVAAAQQVLTDADLVGTTTEARDQRFAAGVVISGGEQPDTPLLRGSTVTLTISTGSPTVPDIPPGTPVSVAEKQVRDAGLQPVRESDSDSDVPDGTVIRTQPRAGTEVADGAEVTLVVNETSDADSTSDSDSDNGQVEVPRLFGRDFDDAEQILEDLDLKVERQTGRLDGLNSRLGEKVIQQSHGPGSRVDRGTTITLTTP